MQGAAAVRRLTITILAISATAIFTLLWTAGSVGAAPADVGGPLPGAQASTGGAAIYADTCSTCHGDAGQGGFTQPSLHGLPLGQASIDSVAAVIRSGSGDMDALSDKLTEEQIIAVSTYVVSEFGAVGDVAQGGELYRLNCAGCHGAAGLGGALIYSEQNAPSLSSTTNATAIGAIRLGPGTMPAFRLAVLSDASAASIADYLAVLRDPPRPGGLSLAPPGPVTEGLIAALVGLGATLIGAAWVARKGRG